MEITRYSEQFLEEILVTQGTATVPCLVKFEGGGAKPFVGYIWNKPVSNILEPQQVSLESENSPPC